jgi:hypothetical protein
MSGDKRLTYQVIATGTADKAGIVIRARIGTEPFIVGSGDKADLKLDDSQLLPVHARLIVTSKGQTLLINMGAPGTMSLNGEAMPSFTPLHWKPGIFAQIGNYELELAVLDIEGDYGQVEKLRPALITQDNEAVSSSDFVIDWGTGRKPDSIEEIPPPKSTILYDQAEILEDFEPKSSADEDTQHSSVESITEAMPFDPHRQETRPVVYEVARTPAMPFSTEGRVLAPLPAVVSSVRGMVVGETLPKDWHRAGNLSAQTTINPINLVAGERVRVPISVHNDYSHPVNLRVYTAGMPREDVILPTGMITVAPGEVTAFDIILHPKIRPPDSPVDFLVRLSDPAAPEAVLTLNMEVVFKDAPNLTGWFEPKIAHDNKPLYFCIQNHTRGTATVFLGGCTEVNGLYVVPEQTQFEIPAGQIVKIPIKFDLPPKRLFLPARYAFSILVREPSRAPLDFPSVIYVGARIRPIFWLLFVVVIIGAFLSLRAILAQPSGVQSATQTPTAEVTVTHTGESSLVVVPIEVTSEVTIEATEPAPTIKISTATKTPRPSDIPTATNTLTDVPYTETFTPTFTETPLFEDPRPTDCSVIIPEGWKPYTVQTGDRVYRLAVDRGTTADEVARVNCLPDPRILQVGQVLLLPTVE